MPCARLPSVVWTVVVDALCADAGPLYWPVDVLAHVRALEAAQECPGLVTVAQGCLQWTPAPLWHDGVTWTLDAAASRCSLPAQVLQPYATAKQVRRKGVKKTQWHLLAAQARHLARRTHGSHARLRQSQLVALAAKPRFGDYGADVTLPPALLWSLATRVDGRLEYARRRQDGDAWGKLDEPTDAQKQCMRHAISAARRSVKYGVRRVLEPADALDALVDAAAAAADTNADERRMLYDLVRGDADAMRAVLEGTMKDAGCHALLPTLAPPGGWDERAWERCGDACRWLLRTPDRAAAYVAGSWNGLEEAKDAAGAEWHAKLSNMSLHPEDVDLLVNCVMSADEDDAKMAAQIVDDLMEARECGLVPKGVHIYVDDGILDDVHVEDWALDDAPDITASCLSEWFERLGGRGHTVLNPYIGMDLGRSSCPVWGWDGYSDLALALRLYHELKEALRARGLELRHDSRLCEAYVMREEGDVDDIVDRMAEMRFFHDHTTFAEALRWRGEDAKTASETAKRAALHVYTGTAPIPRAYAAVPSELRAAAHDTARAAERALDAWRSAPRCYRCGRDADEDDGGCSVCGSSDSDESWW